MRGLGWGKGMRTAYNAEGKGTKQRSWVLVVSEGPEARLFSRTVEFVRDHQDLPQTLFQGTEMLEHLGPGGNWIAVQVTLGHGDNA